MPNDPKLDHQIFVFHDLPDDEEEKKRLMDEYLNDKNGYRWVLASQYPAAPGPEIEGSPELLWGSPQVDPSELRVGLIDGKPAVLMKRVKIQTQ
jgi:hypothetical protein